MLLYLHASLLNNIENPLIQTLEDEIRQKREQLEALKKPELSVEIVDVEAEQQLLNHYKSLRIIPFIDFNY